MSGAGRGCTSYPAFFFAQGEEADDASSSGEEGEDGDSMDEDMAEAQQQQPQQPKQRLEPIIDDDGFEMVQRRRR